MAFLKENTDKKQIFTNTCLPMKKDVTFYIDLS